MKIFSFAKYSWFVLVFNLAVILWGAFVRASKSGAGCGSHWPLCNGQVVPFAAPLQTSIEFAHRVTSGLAFLLVVVMLVWAWRIFPRGHRVRGGAVAAVIGMLAETLAGASLVLFNWVAYDISFGRIIIMPTHLIITFYLLAALIMTAWWASGGAAIRLNGQGTTLWLLVVAVIATLVMGMAGAVTALGDTVLPVSTLTPGVYDNLSASGQLLVALRVWHPLIAIAVAAYIWYITGVIRAARRDELLTRLAQGLLALFLLELGAGALNVYLQVPIWMQLVHLLLANLTWMLLILFSATALRADRA